MSDKGAFSESVEAPCMCNQVEAGVVAICKHLLAPER